MTRAAVALVVLAVSAAAPAAAAPVVSIRAGTEVALEPILRDPGGIRVRGIVQERGSGAAVPHAEVRVVLDDQESRAITDADGRFTLYFAADRSRRHRLAVEFAGAGQFEPSSVEIPELDIAKRPLDLAITAPADHDRASGPLEVTLFTQDELRPASVRVTVHAGPLDADELTLIQEAFTDDIGTEKVLIPPEALGGPGPVRIEARFEGDDVFDPARAHTTVLVRSATAIDLALSSRSVHFEGRVLGRGRLVDDLGDGIAGATVSLKVDTEGGPRALDDALTGPDGRFELEVRASELGAGAHRVQAVFEPVERHLGVSRSAVVPLTVEDKRPVPVGYSLAAFAATAASILAFVGLRTRPWRRWASRLRGESAASAPAPEARRDAPPHTGLTLARPGLVSTLRRPHDHGFGGVVADAVTGRPLAGATVAVTGPDGAEVSATSDDAGGFLLEPLAEGSLRARVSCAGYVTERFPITIPHRGELRDARVDLLPVRERIFSMYREAAEPLLPSPELWGVWTPRQIVDHVRSRQPAAALADLTGYVEEKYFSSRVPDEDEIPRAAERVAAAIAERG